jgi:hypothetical protein
MKYIEQLKKELQTLQVPSLFVYVMIQWELPILPLVHFDILFVLLINIVSGAYYDDHYG